MRVIQALVAATAVALLPATLAGQTNSPVTVIRLPGGGIQPEAAVDASGTIHVVYFSGNPANGDLLYARVNNAGGFTSPIRVNSQRGSAIATGTVRGARLALGRNGRVHVAWNGSDSATPKAPNKATPMLYARLNAAGDAFEPQRNLIQQAVGLDGGGAIAADRQGRVFVAWHAGGPNSRSEGDGRVWLATSADDGATFAPERAVSPADTGACGCCGMDAGIDATGTMFLLYRSARDVVHRDTYLLTSRDGAQSFRSQMLQPWNIGACPMTTYALATSDRDTWASWETDGQVYLARISADGSLAGTIQAPGGAGGKRKHPSLAVDATAQRVLLVWTEGTGWQRGGSAAWQLFDFAGKPIGPQGHADGIPVWGLAAASAKAGGGFVIIY